MSLLRKVRLRVPAGTAKPGPAIGQVRFPNDGWDGFVIEEERWWW